VERGTENAVDFIVRERRRFNAATPASCAHRRDRKIAFTRSTGELRESRESIACRRLAIQ
jgi:hypothetical protein